MNKGLVMMLGILAAIGSKVAILSGDQHKYSSGPKGIPHKGRSRQFHPHAPNDGHWHMKYHRNRV